MSIEKTVFAQLMDDLPKYEFRKCVQRYRANYKLQSFSCWDQFLCMAFAQLTYRQSLRDTETCLRAMQPYLYHMGIRGKVSRSTLTDANRSRDWQVYADFCQILIGIARKLYANEQFAVDLKETVYAFDSTTIDLCLSVFPWARFRRKKGGVKMHTLLDLRGNIPSFIKITEAKLHDVNVLDDLVLEPGSIYVMDRGYIDFFRLYTLNQSLAYFVTRGKVNLKYRRRYSHPIDKSTGLRCDQTIVLTGFYSAKDYPLPLRRVGFVDLETRKRYTFISNNFLLPALTIAQLYKCRWQVELFFKWIKQHLRIKVFYGVSENAVKTQIWIAISVYVLVAIVKKRLNLNCTLYKFLQILSLTIFEKTPIAQLVTNVDSQEPKDATYNQLLLFDL